ncbi:MAG: Gfo/Idh/MocA family oxidoreductase [Candidatus Babeliales bacterium]|nr:Gfo/Idh/MocA family oxidoreductase [Candidatus Babeliales bacterium]
MNIRFNNILALLCVITFNNKIIASESLILEASSIVQPEAVIDSTSFNIVILGYGGRAQTLLLECLKLQKEANKNINVLAICDDNAQEATEYYVKRLYKGESEFAQNYDDVIKNTNFYPDTDDALKQLFKTHTNIDKVLIISENYKHYRHIDAILKYSSCRNIFMEKPLVRTLQEFDNLNPAIKEAKIDVGLTLRYSNMARIIATELQNFKEKLGQLKHVKSWEHVNFGHAFVRIMMNWRKYISLSGGLLLEKSIHDLDLALFLIKSLGINFESISISTQALHKKFKKSQQNALLTEVLNNEELRNCAERWNNYVSKKILKFAYSDEDDIDWPTTLDKFFEDFPEDDNFTNSDIIPDYQKLSAKIKTNDNNIIDYELEVDMSDLKTETNRGIYFEFENGQVEIDIMKSKMVITVQADTPVEFDLQTKNNSHADGDKYIAYAILNALDPQQYNAAFNDDVVQLASLMGLKSEQQALHTQVI